MSLDKALQILAEEIGGGTIVDKSHPFGGLEPVSEPRAPEIYSESCYICNDSSYAIFGLPLCFPCPFCGGHIAADESQCDECGKWVMNHMSCDCGCAIELTDYKVNCPDCGREVVA